MYTLYCRTIQWGYKRAAYFLPWRKPELMEGEGSVEQLPERLHQKGIRHVLLVTDRALVGLGLLDGLFAALEAVSVRVTLYDHVLPNPTIDQVEEALAHWHTARPDALLAVGGGSAIDCAKGVAARIARPDKTIPEMRGQLKIRRQTPPIIAVPTTAGTGSEATIATVLSNPATHEKYAVNDPVLIPQLAVLDPELTRKLPPHITAATGMDALTHAVEAYIGKSNTAETKRYSEEAVKLIFTNLTEAVQNGDNMDARQHMQKAAYFAGIAFTRAYVGYVHAIAHTLGGFYNIPHGLANAVILPHVLHAYGDAAHQRLAELADITGIAKPGDTDEAKANTFIRAVESLNRTIGIPETLDGIREHDIPLMVTRALAEANPLYPVPKIFGKPAITALYHAIRTT